MKQKLFAILTMTCCLIILSCGDDNDGNPNVAPGGGALPASTMMNDGVQAAFAQTQSTAVLGGYPETINVVAADNGCKFLPDHLSNIYYHGVLDMVWNSACFDPVGGLPKSMTTRDYVKRLLDPSVTHIAENGPNVLNSLEAKLLIPCILSLVLPSDKYDDNGLPEPREEPYNFTITQEIITSAEQNCGGLLREDLLGIDMTLKVEQVGLYPDDTFYLKTQLDKFRDGEALETSYYYFGKTIDDDPETGTPYYNIGWQTQPDNPISLGYALLIYKWAKQIRFEQLVEYNSSQISPPNYDDPCNKVNFFRAFVDEENTYMVGQSNHNPHTIYALSGSQANPELNTTKVSIWSPYSFEQDMDEGGMRYPWTTPVEWSQVVFPYNGCIDNPTGVPTSCTLDPSITPLGFESVIGNKFAILADSLDASGTWYQFKEDVDLKFTDEAAVFTAEPTGKIDVDPPADCPYPPNSLNKFPFLKR